MTDDFDIRIINSDLLDVDPDDYPTCNYLLSDPPYGIGIMGEKWDTDIALQVETWQHIMRFLDHGSMITAYCQPKTTFKMGNAIEAAGFETHTILGWLHLQGFCSPARVSDKDDLDNPWYDYRYGSDSLRPIFEPVIIAQKPFLPGSSQRDQILERNNGVYNIQDTRLHNGKHPPIIIITHHIDCNTDSGCSPNCPSKSVMGKDMAEYATIFTWIYNELEYLFYTKKPSKFEKEAGLDDFEDKIMKRVNSGGFSSDPKFEPKTRKNTHRTVKPIEAAKYLSLMFKPPENEKNYIFIPFSGTGSEIIGAMLAGWRRIIAVEIDPYYHEVSLARVEFWKDKLTLGWDSVQKVVNSLKKEGKDQMILF